MSEPEKPKAEAAKGGKGGAPMTPGKILAMLAAGGFGVYLFLLFVSMGIMAIGAAKRSYPEVVIGLIVLVFAVAGMINSFTKD